jgi:hypothetical protein
MTEKAISPSGASQPAPLRRFRPLLSAIAAAAIGTVWLLFTSWRRATIDTDARAAASPPPSGASMLAADRPLPG